MDIMIVILWHQEGSLCQSAAKSKVIHKVLLLLSQRPDVADIQCYNMHEYTNIVSQRYLDY